MRLAPNVSLFIIFREGALPEGAQWDEMEDVSGGREDFLPTHP